MLKICVGIFIVSAISTQIISTGDGIFGFQSAIAPAPILEGPILIIQPSNVTSVLGNTITMSCIFNHPAECSWLQNELPVPIGMRHRYKGVVQKSRDCSLITQPFQLADVGAWQCRGLIHEEFVHSNNAYLVAEDPVIQEGPMDKYVEIDRNVTLLCKFHSIVPKCAWQQDLRDVFIIGRYKYFTKMGENTWDCSIQIVSVQQKDLGKWRCGIPAVSIGGSGGFWSSQASLILKHEFDILSTTEKVSEKIALESQAEKSWSDSRILILAAVGGVLAIGIIALILAILCRKQRCRRPTANIDALSAEINNRKQDREAKCQEDTFGYLIPKEPYGNPYEEIGEHIYYTIPEVSYCPTRESAGLSRKMPEVQPVYDVIEEPLYSTVSDIADIGQKRGHSYRRETEV